MMKEIYVNEKLGLRHDEERNIPTIDIYLSILYQHL